MNEITSIMHNLSIKSSRVGCRPMKESLVVCIEKDVLSFHGIENENYHLDENLLGSVVETYISNCTLPCESGGFHNIFLLNFLKYWQCTRES